MHKKIGIRLINYLGFYSSAFKSFIGTGVLVLPNSIKDSNYFVNVVISFICFYLVRQGILIQINMYNQENMYSLQRMCKVKFGYKMYYFTTATLILLQVLGCVVQVTICLQQINKIVQVYFPGYPLNYFHLKLGSLLLSVPLLLVSSVESYDLISAISTAIILFCFLFLIIQTAISMRFLDLDYFQKTYF